MSGDRSVPLAPDPQPVEKAGRQIGLPGLPPPDRRGLLFALLGGPLAWTVHLMAAYVVVALWCAEQWPGAGVAIALLTLLCGAVAVGSGLVAFRIWRLAQTRLTIDDEPGGPEPWDARVGERGARDAFLAVLSLFLAALFVVLIVLQAMPPLFAPLCPALNGS